MKKLPFCPDCIYYAGRKNGKGTCTVYNTPFVAEHIGAEHWCIKGIKKAESQGAFIDGLRTKFPFKICRKSEPKYTGVLVGVQTLIDGQDAPLYRFPGGVCIENPKSNGIIILEW